MIDHNNISGLALVSDSVSNFHNFSHFGAIIFEVTHVYASSSIECRTGNAALIIET